MPSEIHVGDGSHSCTHLVPTIVGKIVPVALFVVLISVACSSSDPVADPAIDSTNSVEPTPTPQSIVETADVSQNPTAVSSALSHSSTFDDGRYGGVLRIEYIGDFIPDPVVGSNPEDRFFYAEMYSGLTRISDDPSATVETELAESYSVSDSGSTYEFRLRPNLKFSDGSPLTAADFKWSWERALSPASRSPRADEVLGYIQGARAIIEGIESELDGVAVVDDRTLRVNLTAPIAHFPALLTDPVAVVLKQKNVENWGIEYSRWWEPRVKRPGPDTFDELPVGTGPFALTAFDDWEGISVLSRNPHYWNRPAFLERIEFVPYRYATGTEASNPDDNLLQRLTDITFNVGSLVLMGIADPNNGYGKVQSDESARITEFLAFNPAVEPFDDVHFRRALTAAIPSSVSVNPSHLDAPADVLSFTSATGILPPDNPGFAPSVSGIHEDSELALMELSDSRHADRLSELNLRYLLHFPQDSSYIREASAAWSYLLNVQVEIDEIEFERYRRWLESGEMQMMRKMVAPTYPDPHAILSVFADLFGHDTSSPEVVELNRMLNAAATEQDYATRLEMYQEIERYILDNALAIPLIWSQGHAHARVQPWINGYERHKYHGSRFKDVWVDRTHPGYTDLDETQ